MKIKLFAIVALVACAFALPASAAPAPSSNADSVVIPCGTRQQLHLSYTPRAGQLGVFVEFDASGGGSVWVVVPPNQAVRSIPVDNTTRRYQISVPLHPDGPNPIPVQVLGTADGGLCSLGPDLTVTNLLVSFVVPGRTTK